MLFVCTQQYIHVVGFSRSQAKVYGRQEKTTIRELTQSLSPKVPNHSTFSSFTFRVFWQVIYGFCPGFLLQLLRRIYRMCLFHLV